MRRKPTAFFLGDCAFLADEKFRKLARRLHNADDFNSAVGAYFVALASARRNGVPTIDVASETDSSFVSDLVAVGLLNEDGFPEKAFNEWGPSRPKYESDLRTAPSVPKVTKSPITPIAKSSLPFPSIPFSNEGGLGGSPDDGRLDLEAWLLVKRRAPSERQRAFLDSYCKTFDVTGPQRAERIILAHPDDPIAALKDDLDAFRLERLEVAQKAEVPKARPIRPLSGPSAQLAAVLRARESAEAPA